MNFNTSNIKSIHFVTQIQHIPCDTFNVLTQPACSSSPANQPASQPSQRAQPASQQAASQPAMNATHFRACSRAGSTGIRKAFCSFHGRLERHLSNILQLRHRGEREAAISSYRKLWSGQLRPRARLEMPLHGSLTGCLKWFLRGIGLTPRLLLLGGGGPGGPAGPPAILEPSAMNH